MSQKRRKKKRKKENKEERSRRIKKIEDGKSLLNISSQKMQRRKEMKRINGT